MDLIGAFEMSGAQAMLFAGCVPLVTGIVAAIRTAGVPSRMLPLVSLGVGVACGIGVVLALPEPPLRLVGAILMGLSIGLAASGLWSQGKTLLGAGAGGSSGA